MAGSRSHSETREHLLRAALRQFAYRGYAAASVQDIVTEARVSKPALYYHFRDKAGLFQALVDQAHDARYRLMQSAVERGADLRGRLEEILASSFDFSRRNRELMRIAFATAFASPGEMPEGVKYGQKCVRNFEFVHDLMKRAQASGELGRRFDSEHLAFGFYALLNSYLVSQLLDPESCGPGRDSAAEIVDLFLAGAAASKPTRSAAVRRRKG